MAIRFLSGQTIDGTLSVTGNVQAATFNTLPIETARNNNANRIVRTNVHGYVDFGWINTTSGNHTGSITRITASNDAYLRYVTPAQFRTGVTDGFYAPASTVSGVTSVATGNGLIGGTITSTGTLTMSGDYTGIFTVHEGRVWDPTTQGVSKGSIHIDPDEGTDHAGGAITFGASDASSGSNSQAGIYIRSDGSYGTKMYLATTDSYATGSKTALNIDHSGNVNITRGFLQVSNGNISLSGTGRIQGVDTVSASTDAANKAYVDAHPGSGGTVTSVTAGNGLAGGTITTTGTLSTVHLPSFDTRSTNPDPEDYNNLIRFDFKSNGSNGLSDGGSYNGQMTWRSYGGGSDMSGGYPIRLAYTANGNLYRQMGTSATSWGSWNKFALATGTSSQYIRGDGSIATFPTIPPDPTGVYLPLSGGTMTGSIAMSNNNITGIGNLTLNNGWRLQQGGSNYASINSWVYLEGVHGLYTATNGAHFYPNNDSTYGSWQISGSRNSWNGITFRGSGSTHNTLMSSADGATMGLFNDTEDEWYIECIRNGTTKLYYDGNLKLQTTSSGTMAQGTAEATGDMRAPIFYDSNDTNYYVNPNATSNVVNIALKGDIRFPTSSGGNTGGSPAYAIFQEAGAWTYPFPDLRIAMHTGIKFGANASYNGMRFYDDYTMATQVMSVNNSSDGLGAQNVFVNNSLQAGSSLRAPIFYDSNDTAYYLNPASTSNLNGLTVANTITGTISQSNKLAITGYQTNGQSFYQTSGSFAGYSGWANYYIGNHGDGSNYYNTTIIFPFWGPPKYSRLENNNLRGPYNFLNNEVDQTIGVYLQSTTSLRAPIFYDYNNTAFYIDPSTTGTSVNVAGDVVAYASSDIRFKNNVTPITNALDKLSKIGGYTFEWNEISHKETGKKDIGVVAQEVEEILPEIVQTRSNGYKAVDYQKLTALLIESVKEQQFIIDDLKSRIERLEKI